MGEEKKERKIISASEAKAGKSGPKKTASKKAASKKTASKKTASKKIVSKKTIESGKPEVPDRNEPEIVAYESSSKPAKKKKSASGLRIGAIILWVLAILFEVGTIYMLNIAETTYAIIGIILDAICCIAGSLLWKKANRISPTRSKNKVVAFLWNQMGVIACLVAFIPLGLFLLLKTDKVSPKMKKIIAAIAAVAFLGSVGTSIDYNPPTPESVAQAEAGAQLLNADFDGNVYWTRWGKSYHLDENCRALTRSETLITGTLEEAFEAKRNDPCDFCAGGAEAD